MINLSLIDQENNLSKIAKKFENDSNLIKKSKHFSQLLKHSTSILSLLKVEVLIPSNYYLLFTDIYDLIKETIEYYMREKMLKGISIKYIYDSVQQCQFLIPRLYLMILSGSLYLESRPNDYREILYDLINVVKCVQNPLRAFWLRYFLYKEIKDKLPIKNGDYINNKEYFYDYMNISINFLMQNLTEMNHYILRIKKEIYIDNKSLPEIERESIISCELEIIEEISNIKGLTKQIFENKILPKIIKIILESENDWYIQQTIIESIIKYFKIDLYYDSNGIHILLFILSKLINNKNIDIINIYINLLKAYNKFIKSQKKISIELKNETTTKIKIIFHLFLLKYNELQMNYNFSGEKELNKFVDLDIEFMKFTLKILNTKSDKTLTIVNHIMDLCSKRINSCNQGFTIDLIKKIFSLIEKPLKGKYTIFELSCFDKLVNYFDYKSRKEIGLTIIQSLIKKSHYLDTIEKVQKILGYTLPLIAEIKEYNEDDNFVDESFETDEINLYLCKLLSILKSNKPQIMIDIYIKIKIFFTSGSKKCIFFTISSLIHYIINFLSKLELYYKYKFIEKKDDKKIILFDIYDSDNDKDKDKIDEYYIKIINEALKLLKECILIIQKESQDAAFKFYLLSFCQMNKMNFMIEMDKTKTHFKELFQTFYEEAIKIFKNIKNDTNSNIKYNLFTYLCGYLPYFRTLLDKEKIENTVELLENEMSNLNNDKINFLVKVNIAKLYSLIFGDVDRIKMNLNKAFEIAKANSDNFGKINLFNKLINEIFFFIEKDKKYNFIDILNEIIKEIKDNKLLTNETNNNEIKEASNFYNRMIEFINKRKKEEQNSIYNNVII